MTKEPLNQPSARHSEGMHWRLCALLIEEFVSLRQRELDESSFNNRQDTLHLLPSIGNPFANKHDPRAILGLVPEAKHESRAAFEMLADPPSQITCFANIERFQLVPMDTAENIDAWSIRNVVQLSAVINEVSILAIAQFEGRVPIYLKVHTFHDSTTT